MVEPGELYKIPNNPFYVFVLAIAEESDDKVVMSILWTNPHTYDTGEPDVYEANKSDLKKWKVVNV